MKTDRIGYGLAALLIFTGAGHFVAPGPLDQIVPPFLPLEPRFWTYLSGVAELAVAVMLLSPLRFKLFGKSIKQLGIWSAFALFVLVYPANIYMAIDWLDRPMPEPIIAFARLPLQFGLYYWCYKINTQLKTVSKV